MAFHTSVDELPVITTWELASHYESKIKPIRGRSVETKPLGKRSNDSVTIRRDRDKIIICLYSTDILTYEKMGDGQTMIRICSGGWATQSTAKVIGHILKTDTCRRRGTLWISFDVGRDARWYALHDEVGHAIEVTTDGYSGFNVVDYLPPLVTKIDKEKIKEVRKQYKAFKQYIRRMAKVLGDADGIIRDIPDRDVVLREHGLALSYARYDGEGEPDESTLDNFHRCMMHMMYASWKYEGWNVRCTSYQSMYRCLEGMIKKYHHEEITYKERYSK